MRDTTVTILRGGNDLTSNTLVGLDGRLATGILVQVDQMDVKEVVAMQQIYGWYGKIGYKVITTFWNANALIRQDDVLVDEHYLDVDTNTNYRYHVVGRPKDYAPFHQEVICDVTVGT
jgi:hypothetical protein